MRKSSAIETVSEVFLPVSRGTRTAGANRQHANLTVATGRLLSRPIHTHTRTHREVIRTLRAKSACRTTDRNLQGRDWAH